MDWFNVDKEGLAKILERRGRAFAVLELVQNAWDENSSQVDVILEHITGRRGRAKLVVEDDNPDGFQDIAHSYTLFAESYKKDNPEQRGRFNLGGKLVLSICDEARIISTDDGVVFNENGRNHSPKRTDSGSRFEATMRMTKKQVEATHGVVESLIPPSDVVTTYNGMEIPQRTPEATFEITLPTEIADEEGRLKRTRRKTEVAVYEPLGDEDPHIYEMGIPVVETDRWHLDVQQKVPLSMERDNVTPAYAQKLRTAVVNRMSDRLSDDEAAKGWVTDGISDPDADPDAVEEVVQKRFGKKAVIHDPSDPEANKKAASQGYEVVSGGTLPGGAWENIKENEILEPAGQVTPSPDPYSDDPDAPEVDEYPQESWTTAMERVVEFTAIAAEKLLGISINIRLVSTTNGFGACWVEGGLQSGFHFNVTRLGRSWFEPENRANIIDLIIHEFGHHYSGDHLSEEYYDALTDLGARMTEWALEEPEAFELLDPAAAGQGQNDDGMEDSLDAAS